MSSATYGKSRRSSAFGWFLHRITGTFLIFLLITHFWIQHYDRTTASISHDVVTAEQAADGMLPTYSEEANLAVRQMRERRGQMENLTAPATPHDVLMLRLGDPVYAVLWKGFNLLFLIAALHHGFYGLNNILSDYIRNDMARTAAVTLSWGLALVLLVVGAYSVTVAGLSI